MNKLNNLINRIISVFTNDSEMNNVRNSLNHLLASHKSAEVAIADAYKTFENTRDAKVCDFENVKKATLARTEKAVNNLVNEVADEEEKIEAKYYNAKSRLSNKSRMITELNNELSRFTSMEFPLK